ncbi:MULTISPECIES: hypothetical protein [Crocosphaera]|uniref:Uncharacterized protein n=2 Tax=Crocosphaera watsonii TaxID=263511 RepID=T2JQ17_CROWT|nr:MULTISPECIES: hypothetical protein [Crocosphaera]CCQ49170.1 hypothetical protein CWATWH8502_3455 [Crocosphaera watsonii WH 8502]CCQ67154.1 hypothetical protein CWATWH0402_140 [Crocosphaera watsonii WH 0402]
MVLSYFTRGYGAIALIKRGLKPLYIKVFSLVAHSREEIEMSE